MLRNCRFLFLALLASAALCGCDVRVKSGSFDEDKIRSLAAVEQYRELYEKNEFARLYDLASPALKAAVPKDHFISTARSATARHGKYKSSVLIGSSCFPNEVRLAYDTEFEKAVVRELFIWSVPDGQATLQAYQVLPDGDEFHKESQVGCPVP